MKNHCYMRLCYMWTGQLLVRSPPLWLAGLLKIPVSIHNPPLLLSNSLSIQGEEELPSSHHPSTSLIGSANYPSREQIRFLGNYIPSNVVHSIIKSFVGVSMGTTDSSRFSNIWRLFFLAGKHLFLQQYRPFSMTEKYLFQNKKPTKVESCWNSRKSQLFFSNKALPLAKEREVRDKLRLCCFITVE